MSTNHNEIVNPIERLQQLKRELCEVEEQHKMAVLEDRDPEHLKQLQSKITVLRRKVALFATSLTNRNTSPN